MRTTLTIETDIAARLKAESRRSGRPFKAVVNECLRAGLAQQRAGTATAHFTVKARDFGVMTPGLSLDNIGELLERAEGPDQP